MKKPPSGTEVQGGVVCSSFFPITNNSFLPFLYALLQSQLFGEIDDAVQYLNGSNLLILDLL